MKTMFVISDIKKALTLSDFDSLEAQLKMTPVVRPVRRPPERAGQVRLGGVLALFYHRHDELYLVLTRRRDDLNSHAGQISFPGGKRDDGESLLETALRETEEEIGVGPTHIQVLGQLSMLYIPPSDFEVHPYVAYYDNGSPPSFIPSEAEVAEIIEAPFRLFFDPEVRRQEPWNLRGTDILVPYFQLGSHKIWGATAMMLNELIERVQRVVS